MAQEIAADAGALGNDIKATGHAAVYGIHDSGMSVVKPESQAALQEVAKLLSGDLELRLPVVGHTGSVGRLDANMRLSQPRARPPRRLPTAPGRGAPRTGASSWSSRSPPGCRVCLTGPPILPYTWHPWIFSRACSPGGASGSSHGSR